MIRFVSILAVKLRLWSCLGALAASILLATSGCTQLNLRGERFPDDPMSETARRLRQVDERTQSSAFSNKARQIDRSLGVQ